MSFRNSASRRTGVAAAALAGVLLSQLLACARGNAFLGHAGEDAEGSRSLPQAALLDELDRALGSKHRAAMEARLGKIEDGLRTIYAALPKNRRGALGAPAARYAMHRLFVQRHGWQVKGLEPEGEAWASSSPALALGDRLPGEVVDLFETRLGTHGFDLHELAVLAATLEHLIHGEAVGRLSSTYRALEKDQEVSVTDAEATHLVETYMASYILGRNISAMTPAQVAKQNTTIRSSYPGWPETQAFLHEVQYDVARGRDSYTFDAVSQVVEEVGERYGRWQSRECQDLKSTLLKFEEANGTGRVHVADFYGGALNDGHWQFSESIDYLRQLGALEDSDEGDLRVIIPNYINGPSNCVASSSYYSVCCIDECEGYMSHLERAIAAPSATPAEILRHVAALPLVTGAVSPALAQKLQEVSPALAQKLQEVADHHSGKVPLHGRLFAQWMHHAFPRDCPYPHVSGTTNPKPAGSWEQSTGRASTVTKDQIEYFVKEARTNRKAPEEQTEGGLCSAMWTSEEELVDPEGHEFHHQAASAPSARLLALLRVPMLCLALGASLVLAARKALESFGAASEALAGSRAAAPSGFKQVFAPSAPKVYSV